ELLRTDSIYIRSNLTVENLAPLSAFLGKLGNPEQAGLELAEFKRRQKLHHDAEIRTFQDVPAFIERAQRLYGYQNFLNDAGGSLCELDDPSVMHTLAEHTVVIYLQASSADEELLIERAQSHPKPLYYRATFLDEQLAIYLRERNLRYVAEIDPDDFVTWVFPALFRSRVPRYESLAQQYGYTVDARQVLAVRDERDFLDLVADSIDRHDTAAKD
ncbi:MAG: ATPase, partial [Granulosicoccaceae bacterium]